MRRNDRAVTDPAAILDIIDRCPVLRLGLADGETPYIVPVNFAYEKQGEQLFLYFHSAQSGRKAELLKKRPRVCFEMDASFQITTGAAACDWSANYESVIGYAEAALLETAEEKSRALDLLMARFGYEGRPEFHPGALEKTLLCRLAVAEMTGKRRMA